MNQPKIDIDRLDVEQRLQLIEQLWDSLAANPNAIPITEIEKRELDRRLNEIDGGDVEGIPWEEVRKRIQGRLK